MREQSWRKGYWEAVAETCRKKIRSTKWLSRVNLWLGFAGYGMAIYFGWMMLVYLQKALFVESWYWALVVTNLLCGLLWGLFTSPRSIKTAKTYQEARQTWMENLETAELNIALYSDSTEGDEKR